MKARQKAATLGQVIFLKCLHCGEVWKGLTLPIMLDELTKPRCPNCKADDTKIVMDLKARKARHGMPAAMYTE